MDSIVLALQAEITLSNCDVVNVLRNAHLIATKLNLSEFDQWIKNELNGYPNQDSCPNYRKIRGSLHALHPYYGWIPLTIPDKAFEKNVCDWIFTDSLSVLVSSCKSSKSGLLSVTFPGERIATLNEIFNGTPVPMQYALHISTTAVMDIAEKVKNTILEWTLKLEAMGIVGESMSFSEKEKMNASALPETVNFFCYGNANIIASPSNSIQINSGNGNAISFSYEAVTQMVDEIDKSIHKEKLTPADMETALELLSDLKSKIGDKKSPHIIKSALVGLKDFLINAGANIAAAIIQTKMMGQ